MLPPRRSHCCGGGFGMMALPLLLLVVGPPFGGRAAPAAKASEPACPAGGGGGPDCLTEADTRCMRWRQTGGCNPKGPREKHGDKPCDAEIPTGSSGYCQCGSGEVKLKVREVTCDHRPFNCATECLQARRYQCVSWRQTGGCSSDGAREPAQDKSCDDEIHPRMSGYCECGGGRIVRKPGCDSGELLDSFKCREECAAEPGLYEELEVDSGATDKEIKQAFRKLSLKYHPDKTRSNPVLSARFAAIREAYDILGDAEQRAIFDAAGLKMVMEARNQKLEKGPAMHGEVHVSLEGMYKGEEFQTTVNRKVICRGCAERFTERCHKCNAGCAHEIELRNVQMGPMVVQQQVQVPSKQKCRTQAARVTVTVEPGMSAGDTLVFKSMGEQQPKKIPGDIVLKIKEKEHKVFKRVGVDLHTEIEISLREALLGFEFTLTHLDGHKVMVGFNGVMQPFGVLKISEEGMPHRGDPTQRGDLFVKCRIAMPKDGLQWLKENAGATAGASTGSR